MAMVRTKRVGALSLEIWCHSPLTYIAGMFSDSWRKNRWRERIPNRRKCVQNGGNTFYDRKHDILMKILEFKRSWIGMIAEFRGILNGFPNQGDRGPVWCEGHTLAATAMRYVYCSGGGGGGGADMTIALMRQGQGDDSAGPAQVRQGWCNDGVTTEVMRERENG